MPENIHPTAVIEGDVNIGANVKVGAYAVIRGEVTVGDGTEIMDHAVLYGRLKIGEKNTIHPGAVIGNISQDLKFGGEETEVIIGNENSIRECATIQQGTAGGGSKTIVGNNNLIMAYAHVAHDCIIGNRVIITNAVQIAGHVVVQDYARIEGIVGIHQFVTVGAYSFVGFLSRITKDVPPFMIVEGHPARERSINVVGLHRAGFTDSDIALIKKAYKVLYISNDDIVTKIARLNEKEFCENEHTQKLAAFVEATSNGKNGRALEAVRS